MSCPEEDELESYLQRRALLRSHHQAHRSYQDRLEPPPELDRIVLRKARLAIQSRPAQPASAPPPPVTLPVMAPRPIPLQRTRWYAPASYAATMLVCLTVLVDIGAHALRGDATVASTQIHEEAAESVAAQPSGPVLTKVADAEPQYGGAPIPEVVIRAARLTTRPASPRSASPASR